MYKIFSVLFFLIICFGLKAQRTPDGDYMPNIQSVQFIQAGKPLSYPIVKLGELQKLRLDFDDFDYTIKNYFYTFVHCNADWQPSLLIPVNYMKELNQKRITRYSPSSISKQKYIHYTLYLPEVEAMPTQSGNYILKVFLDGDTSKLAFTRRLLIVEDIAGINAQVVQPFDANKMYTHQKVQFEINTQSFDINNYQMQLKVCVLQNYRWDIAAQNLQPNFIRRNSFEYNDENTLVFVAGKEFRWLDMSNLRMRSDKMQSIDDSKNIFQIKLFPDVERVSQPFMRYDDFNGAWIVRTTDGLKSNPNLNGDYAMVNFQFAPENPEAFANKNIFWAGRKNNYLLNEKAQMVFNPENNLYEISLLLKEGYYTYCYVSKDKNADAKTEFTFTEGNDWQAENNYTILVYYRAVSDFADRLVGIREVNSVQEAN